MHSAQSADSADSIDALKHPNHRTTINTGKFVDEITQSITSDEKFNEFADTERINRNKHITNNSLTSRPEIDTNHGDVYLGSPQRRAMENNVFNSRVRPIDTTDSIDKSRDFRRLNTDSEHPPKIGTRALSNSYASKTISESYFRPGTRNSGRVSRLSFVTTRAAPTPDVFTTDVTPVKFLRNNSLEHNSAGSTIDSLDSDHSLKQLNCDTSDEQQQVTTGNGLISIDDQNELLLARVVSTNALVYSPNSVKY